MDDLPNRDGYTNLRLTLTGLRGVPLASMDWQAGADRLVHKLGMTYAAAHRVLQTVFPEVHNAQPADLSEELAAEYRDDERWSDDDA